MLTAMSTVETERLSLVSLPPELVAALVEGDLARAAALAPFPVDETTFAEDEYVLRLRHRQLEADPTEEPWLYRASVLRSTGEVVGRGGFHSRPDADGVVEIGYSTRDSERRKGYARELVVGLLGWGAAQGARRCIASVRPDNAASLGLVRSLGFVEVGQEVDEVDGLELVHALDLDGYSAARRDPSRHGDVA